MNYVGHAGRPALGKRGTTYNLFRNQQLVQLGQAPDVGAYGMPGRLFHMAESAGLELRGFGGDDGQTH